MRRHPSLCVVLFLWLLKLGLFGQSNDNFANRLPLTGPNPIAVSNLSHATVEPGEPHYAGISVGKSLWWTWTAPVTEVVNFSTYGSSGAEVFNSSARTLAIYTGSSISALTEIASNSGVNTRLSSLGIQVPASIDVSVTAGAVYQIAVDETRMDTSDGLVVLSIKAPPAIVSAARATGVIGQSFSYIVEATNNPVTYAATGLPPGLSLNATLGVINGTPLQNGAWPVTISATNLGGTTTVTVFLVISDPSASPAPTVYGPMRALGTVGAPFQYVFNISGQLIQAQNLPPGLTLDAGFGEITGTPTAVGIYTVPFSVTNSAAASQGVLTLEITPPQPPVIGTPLESIGTVGAPFNQYLETYDFNDNAVFDVGALPPGLIYDPVDQFIKGVPTTPGVYTVPVSASTGGGTTPATLTIVVNPAAVAPSNVAPTLTSMAAASGVRGTAFTYQLTAPGASTFTAFGLPSGLSLNQASGEITGTPLAVGVSQVAVSAANGVGVSNAVLTISISAAATTAIQPLTVASAAEISGSVGAYLNYYFGFTQSPVSQLTGTFGSLPPGLVSTITQYGASISGTPTTAGTYSVPVSFTGQSSNGVQNVSSAGSATLTFNITASGSMPTAAPGAITSALQATGVIGANFSYSISTLNPATSFIASGLPPGLSIAAGAGLISGKPTASGIFPVVITAANSAGSASGQVSISITSPSAPVITSSSTMNGLVGQGLSYSIYAGGSIVSYTASNLPPGLVLNSTSGVISGTPTTAGSYAAPVSANNGNGVANAVITFAISGTVTPLVVTSNAAVQGTVGSSLSYYYAATPSTPSPAFSVGALPPGLSNIASSNVIQGTPTQAGVFTTPITVTNSAGSATSNIEFVIAPPNFSLSSPAEASGSVGSSLSYTLSTFPSMSNVTYGATNLPAGLSLNSSTGVIGGIPTAAGVSVVNISATCLGVTANAALTVAIANQAPPLITSPNGVEGTVGAALNYKIAATNVPTSFAAQGLPSGLTLNSSTGVISGAPATNGAFSVHISATNGAGAAGAILSINIFATPSDPPVISSPAMVVGSYFSPLSYTVTATNLPTSISVTNLPSGLSYNSTTHVISGTPQVYGLFTATVTAPNAIGVGSAKLTFNISYSSVGITSPAGAAGLVNGPFSYGITSTASPATFSSTALPAGLTLDPNSGIISGRPSGSAGSYVVSVTATTADGSYSGTAPITIAIAGSPTRRPTFTGALEVAALVGQSFSYSIGGTYAPTLWTASNLPAGLALDPTTGIISGSPKAAGDVQVTLSATNSVGTRTGAMTISTAALSPAPVITSALSFSANVGVFAPLYSIVASNGPTSFGASNLPPGLSVDPASGVISGTPTAAGVFAASVSASNAAGVSTAGVTMNVAPAPAPFVTFPASSQWTLGTDHTINFSESDANANFSVSGLPAGVYYDPVDHLITGVTPPSGIYSFTVSMTNAAGALAVPGTIYVPATSGPPVITYGSAEISMNAGQISISPFSYSGAGPIRVSAVGLPPGVSLDVESAYVSLIGEPSAPGVYPVSFTATSPYGVASVVETIIVQNAPPTFAGSAGSRVVVNQPFFYRISASSGITGYTASNLPPGLVFDPQAGSISGIPTQAGVYSIPLTASNRGGTTAVVYTLTVLNSSDFNSPPVITSPAAVSYNFANQAYYYASSAPQALSYYIAGTNFPLSFAATNLPAGFSLNPSTGQIYGFPQSTGTYVATISATNAAGTGRAQLTFMFSRAAPVLNEPLVVNGAVGARLTHVIVNDQLAPIQLYANPDVSISTAGLPPGLSLNAPSDVIFGVPSQSGDFPVAITLSNLGGSVTTTVTFRIAASAPAADPPQFGEAAAVAGVVGGPFHRSLTATGAVSYQAVGLPPGLSIDPATGVVSGVPLAYGVFPVSLSAANSAGTANVTWTVIVAAHGSPIAFHEYPILTETAGASFSEYLSATQSNGGALVYSASNLPPGLALDSSAGRIHGAISTPGVYTIPIMANSAGVAASAELTLIVQPSAASPAILASAEFLGYVDVPFSGSLFGDGLVTSATPIPPGLSFDAPTQLIFGAPTQAGVTAVNLSASNSFGASHATPTVVLETPTLSLPMITNQPMAQAALQGQSATFSVQAVGIPTPTFQWNHNGAPVSGATSATLTLTNISGTDAGAYTVTVSNSSGSVASATALLTLQQTFGNWQTANFSPGEIAQGLAEDLVSFNKDGLCNLLEYALDRNPKTELGGSAPPMLLNASDGYLAFRFTRDPALTDIDYIVEASEDLVHWDQIAQSAGGAATLNLGGAHLVSEVSDRATFQVTVEDEVPAAFAASRYFRLRIYRHP